MAEDFSEKINEGKLDLVPMIDCIMLLLLFFILTTKFTPVELAIASILPTDKGERQTIQTAPVPLPKQIDIRIYPEGMLVGYQPSDYLRQFHELIHRSGIYIPNADMRIGGDEPLTIPGMPLTSEKSVQQEQVVAAIRSYVITALKQREKPDTGSRTDQDPVVIHCFSGLSWKFALVVYDAVRCYELDLAKSSLSTNATHVVPVREITFSPRPTTTHTDLDAGDELFEIVNMR